MATTSSTSSTSPAELTIEAGTYSQDVDLDAEYPESGEQYSYNVSTNDRLSVTSPLQVSVPAENEYIGSSKINHRYYTYKNTPSNISFDGNGNMSYTIDGQTYSTQLSSEQADIINSVQQDMDEAASYIDNSGGGGSQFGIASQSTSSSTSAKFQAMSDKEIKKWFKDIGYKVKKLGNRRFKLIRKIKKDYRAGHTRIVSIFNANTLEREQTFSTSHNGKRKTSHFMNKAKDKFKSKIKRSDNSYLMLEVKNKKNN